MLVAALCFAAYWYLWRPKALQTDDKAVYQVQPVGVGNLRKTVYGSGMIRAANQPVLTAGASGTVVRVPVEPGDTVRAGQVLLVMENPDLDAQIRDLEYSRWEKDLSIASSTIESEPSSVKAPAAGRVMQVNVREGDDALAKYREYGSVVILSTDGRMKVEFA
ncbi:MAG TPA: biotin/lipoyl-binding protein, partial [Clostridia bacterium]|nr:biotin/lipoyl-binding protein [Clostridia bacterium]